MGRGLGIGFSLAVGRGPGCRRRIGCWCSTGVWACAWGWRWVGVAVGVVVAARVGVDREVAWLFPNGGEPHSRIIGAGRGASFTHPIRVASPAGVASGIGISARVRECRDQDAVPVHVDVV